MEDLLKEHEKAPCPCESGKRYVDCCLQQHIASSERSHARAFNEEIRAAIEGRAFDSIEAMNEFVRDYCDRSNAQPKVEFLGLSPDQVRHLLDFPPEASTDLVRLSDSFSQDDMAGVPVVRNAAMFLQALSEAEPLKATATGNLPRDFSKRLFGEIDRSAWKEHVKFRSEADSMTIHTLRLVLTMGGWLKRSKGAFRLTRKGGRSVERGFSAADYLDLLWTFARKFNWGYQDYCQKLEIIQRAFLFSLFIIHKKARNFIEDYRLAPYFIRAFPLVLEEAGPPPDDPYNLFDPYWRVNICYRLRFLERFCAYFGLIDTKSRGKDPFNQRFFFKASRFFDTLLTWKI